MTRSDNTRILVESALLVAISTLFCVLDAYIPIFALVYPLPIVILVVRTGTASRGLGDCCYNRGLPVCL